MTLFADPRVAEILGGDLCSSIEGAFRSMEIAEDEIARARGTTEVDRDDPLWDAFGLLRPTHDLMRTEFVYRSHCREILARVRDGRDTRPATDAEIAVGIGDASMKTPLRSDVVALQIRIFARAFPEQYAILSADGIPDYEPVHGQAASEWEVELRKTLRQDWRTP